MVSFRPLGLSGTATLTLDAATSVAWAGYKCSVPRQQLFVSCYICRQYLQVTREKQSGSIHDMSLTSQHSVSDSQVTAILCTQRFSYI